MARVNLRTACGCSKSFFYTTPDPIPLQWVVPIFGRNHLALFGLDRLTVSKRSFKLVNYQVKSSRRIEVWYEEVPFV